MAGNKKNLRKFYAVSSGRRVGIFTSWNMASQSVTGCPNATVKAYESLDQAKAAMRLAGHSDPHIFGEEESGPSTINWAEQSEMTEEEYEEVNAEETEEEDEDDKKETCEHLEVVMKCVCKEEKEERILKCSDCGHRIHWTCTELPLYQLCIYINTHRKFTCKLCASKFIDDKTSEEYQRALSSAKLSAVREEKSSASTESPQQHTTSSVSDTFLSQMLTVQHQTTTTVLRNIEAAMTALVEQTQQAEETRGDAIALLMNDRQPKPALRDAAVMTTAVVMKGDKQQGKQHCGGQGKDDHSTASFPHKTPIPHSSSPAPGTSSTPPPIPQPSVVVPATAGGNVPSSTSLPLAVNTTAQGEDMTDTDDSSDSDDDDSYASACEDDENIKVTKVNKNQADPSLPHLFILHDSVLNDIDGERLGKSYGFRVTKRKTSTVKECVQDKNVDDAPDAILIHVGVNDLKTQAPEAVGQELCKRIHTLLKQQANTNIIISKLAPTTNDTLFAKGEVLNALLFAEFFATECVSFISHHQLQRQGNKGHLKDDLHPSLKGSGIMAGNIGRHVHGLFWEKPKQRRRRTSPRKAAGGQKTDQNTGHSDETTQDHRYRNNRPLDTRRGHNDRRYRYNQLDWRYRSTYHSEQYRDRRYTGQHRAGRYRDEDYRDWQSRRDQASRHRNFRDQRSDNQHRENVYGHNSYSRHGSRQHQNEDDYYDRDDDAARYRGYEDRRSYRPPHHTDYRDRRYNRWSDKRRY